MPELVARVLDRFPSLKRRYFARQLGVPLEEVPEGVRHIGLTRPPEAVFEHFRQLHGLTGPAAREEASVAEPSRYETRPWSDEPIPIYVATAPLPSDPPLGGDAVAALPDGVEIIVRWGGGNGPHHYQVQRDEDGTLWTLSDGKRGHDPLLIPDLDLHLFGAERWQHKVWLAAGSGPEGDS